MQVKELRENKPRREGLRKSFLGGDGGGAENERKSRSRGGGDEDEFKGVDLGE